ncbi:hypothetical protein [Yoonia sp.]|uniref:hypothetical protein n=1 Tax=Yoonia sp. TaxID=2212373 RepID=UPI0023B5DC98
MARTDEIDKVLSSVRNLVSLKEKQKAKTEQRLVLMPDQRVSDEIDTENTGFGGAFDADNVLKLTPQHKDASERLEATIAELEATVAAQSDQFEVDGGEEFAEAAWAASAFEAPRKAPDEDAEIAPEDDTESELSAHDALMVAITQSIKAGLDQDVLRDLVVNTVHEELSGELGERITQNVRKMVRREIKRAMTNRDFGQD